MLKIIDEGQCLLHCRLQALAHYEEGFVVVTLFIQKLTNEIKVCITTPHSFPVQFIFSCQGLVMSRLFYKIGTAPNNAHEKHETCLILQK